MNQPVPPAPQSLNMRVSPESRAKFSGFLEGVKSKAVTSQMPPPMPPQMPMQPPMQPGMMPQGQGMGMPPMPPQGMQPPMMPQQPPMMMNMGGMVDVFDPRYMNEGGFVISTDDSGKIRTRPVFDEDRGRVVSQILSNQMVDEMEKAAMAKANQPEPTPTVIENEQLPSLGDVISEKILSTTVQPEFTGDEANLTGIERIANQPELASVPPKFTGDRQNLTGINRFTARPNFDEDLALNNFRLKQSFPEDTFGDEDLFGYIGGLMSGQPGLLDEFRNPEYEYGGLGALGGIESGVDDTSLSEGQGGVTGLTKTSTQDQIANLLNDIQSQVSGLISGDVDTIEDMPEIASSNVEEKIRDAESGVDTSWINNDVLDTIADIETGNSHFETRQAGPGPSRPQLTLGAAGELGAYQIMPSTAADPGIGLMQNNPNLKPINLNNASEAEHREFAKNFLIALQRNNPTASKEEIIRMYNLGQSGAKNNPRNMDYLNKFLASYQSKTGDKRLLNQGGIVQGFRGGGVADDKYEDFSSNISGNVSGRNDRDQFEEARDLVQAVISDNPFGGGGSSIQSVVSPTVSYPNRDSDDLGSATNIFTPVGGNFSDFAQSEAPISGIGMEQALANQAKSIPNTSLANIDLTNVAESGNPKQGTFEDLRAEIDAMGPFERGVGSFFAKAFGHGVDDQGVITPAGLLDFRNQTQATAARNKELEDQRRKDQDDRERQLLADQQLRALIASMMPPTAATTPTPPMVGLPDAPVADPVAPDYGSVVVPSDRVPGFDVGKISPYPQFRMPTEYKPIFPPAISANYFKDLFKNMGVKNMQQGGSVNQLDSAIDNFINAYR
jgi:hypothetical protein